MFLGTRKGVPTNRAGTPDGVHLEGPPPLAKPYFGAITGKKPLKALLNQLADNPQGLPAI